MYMIYFVLFEKCKQYFHWSFILFNELLGPLLKTLACFLTFTKTRSSALTFEPFTH